MNSVIVEYTPSVNYDVLGFDITTIFNLEVVANVLSETTSSLKNSLEVIEIHRVTGSYDLIVIGKYESTAPMNGQV